MKCSNIDKETIIKVKNNLNFTLFYFITNSYDYDWLVLSNDCVFHKMENMKLLVMKQN